MRNLRVMGLVLVAALAPSALATQNDAGSGGDAGDTPGTAYALPALGTYHGLLAPSEQDWFLADVGGGARCVSAEAVSVLDHTMRFAVASATGATHSVTIPSKDFFAVGGIASPAATSALLGLEDTSAATNPYAFRLRSFGVGDLGPGDGGSGGDAGSTPETALPLGPPCLAGEVSLRGGGLDPSDVYNFTGTLGQRVTLTLAAGEGLTSIALLGPGGFFVGPSFADETLAVTLPADGAYFVSVQSGGSTSSYLVGFASDPPGDGCEPGCIL